MLEKDPADRYQTPSELLRDLHRILYNVGLHAGRDTIGVTGDTIAPARPRERKASGSPVNSRRNRNSRRQWLAYAIAIAILLALLLLLLVLIRTVPEEGRSPAGDTENAAIAGNQPSVGTLCFASRAQG